MKRQSRYGLGLASAVVLGIALADFAGHLFGRPSPHPAWLTAVIAAIGLMLLLPLLPERGWARLMTILRARPWRKPAE